MRINLKLVQKGSDGDGVGIVQKEEVGGGEVRML
jgi:hypothetical protein